MIIIISHRGYSQCLKALDAISTKQALPWSVSEKEYSFKARGIIFRSLKSRDYIMLEMMLVLVLLQPALIQLLMKCKGRVGPMIFADNRDYSTLLASTGAEQAWCPRDHVVSSDNIVHERRWRHSCTTHQL